MYSLGPSDINFTLTNKSTSSSHTKMYCQLTTDQRIEFHKQRLAMLQAEKERRCRIKVQKSLADVQHQETAKATILEEKTLKDLVKSPVLTIKPSVIITNISIQKGSIDLNTLPPLTRQGLLPALNRS